MIQTRLSTLSDWLAWQQRLHPRAVDLGLERVREVFRRMGSRKPAKRVVTVAGTNGKGSCVALLEHTLTAAGYRVGAYTSPHLHRYNERIRIDGREVSDGALCNSFERVEGARGDTSLTNFEFGTLAALDLFAAANLDLVLLEVGLGGRLDAVNIIDADVALITSIGLDHAAELGSTREEVAREKAGIFRPGRPAICGEPLPPASLFAAARDVGAPLYRFGSEFGYEHARSASWTWWSPHGRWVELPWPGLAGEIQLRNASAALAVIEHLAPALTLTRAQAEYGLRCASLPGRFQIVPGPVTRIFDVSHNPQAAQVLAEGLNNLPCVGFTHAVVGMLRDKDIGGVMAAVADAVDFWYLAGIGAERGADAGQLAEALKGICPAGQAASFDTVGEAYLSALSQARPGDRVVVFGSFYTVAEVVNIDPHPVVQHGAAFV